MDREQQKKKVKIITFVIWLIFCGQTFFYGCVMLIALIFNHDNVEEIIGSVIAGPILLAWGIGGWKVRNVIQKSIFKNIDENGKDTFVKQQNRGSFVNSQNKGSFTNPTTNHTVKKSTPPPMNKSYPAKEDHEHINQTYDYTIGEHQIEAKLGMLCPRCGESFYVSVRKEYARCPKCHKKISVT